MFLRRTQGCRSRRRAFVKQIKGLHRGVMNFLRVREHALLSFKPLVFTRLYFGIFNFALLKCPEIDEPKAVLLALLKLFDLVLDVLPGLASFSHRLEIGSRETVE